MELGGVDRHRLVGSIGNARNPPASQAPTAHTHRDDADIAHSGLARGHTCLKVCLIIQIVADDSHLSRRARDGIARQQRP